MQRHTILTGRDAGDEAIQEIQQTHHARLIVVNQSELTRCTVVALAVQGCKVVLVNVWALCSNCSKLQHQRPPNRGMLTLRGIGRGPSPIPLWEGQFLSPPKVRFLISNRRIGLRPPREGSAILRYKSNEVAVCNIGVKICAISITMDA